MCSALEVGPVLALRHPSKATCSSNNRLTKTHPRKAEPCDHGASAEQFWALWSLILQLVLLDHRVPSSNVSPREVGFHGGMDFYRCGGRELLAMVGGLVSTINAVSLDSSLKMDGVACTLLQYCLNNHAA